MAISRNQLVKELEPGLNALFGLEYKQYENQSAEIYTTESSDRAFEEEVMLSGFANELLSLSQSLRKLLKITCMTDLLLDTQKH